MNIKQKKEVKERIKLRKKYEDGFRNGQEEYKLFILNILRGIDIADKQMGNKNCGTKAIRLAIKSRII